MQVKDCELIKPLACEKNSTAIDVAKILKESKQRRLFVTDTNQTPIGVVSTTDINNKVVANGKDASRVTAQEIMSTPPHIICDVEDKLSDVYNKMLSKKNYFCPVTKNDKLYGVITYGQILKKIQDRIEDG